MLIDRLTTVNPRAVLRSAYAALSGAQSLPPHDQVMGAFVYCRLVAEGCGLDTAELLAKADRIIRDADTAYQPEVSAARQYVTEELKRGT